MKTKKTTIYICEYCNKVYQRRDFAIMHEIVCYNNPNNFRVCSICNNLEKKETIIYYDNPLGGEIERTVELFYCNKINSYLYPAKVEIKNNMFDLGDDLNEPMKKQCDIFDKESTKLDEFFKLK